MNGLHLIGDLRECRCDPQLLLESAGAREKCLQLVAEAGLTALEANFRGFESGGYTGVVLLAESHVALHTWPERKGVTLDVYVCNYGADNSAKARRLFEDLAAYFAPAEMARHALTVGYDSPEFAAKWMAEAMPYYATKAKPDPDARSRSVMTAKVLMDFLGPGGEGDANASRTVNFADITSVLAHFGASPGPWGPGDANGDGLPDIMWDEQQGLGEYYGPLYASLGDENELGPVGPDHRELALVDLDLSSSIVLVARVVVQAHRLLQRRLDRLLRHPTLVLFLGPPQDWNDCRCLASGRVFRHRRLRPGQVIGAEGEALGLDGIEAANRHSEHPGMPDSRRRQNRRQEGHALDVGAGKCVERHVGEESQADHEDESQRPLAKARHRHDGEDHARAGEAHRRARALIGAAHRKLMTRRVGVIGGRRDAERHGADGDDHERDTHRSTSPNTMSREPRTAETSASMWPRQMWSMAWRWAKPGALILQR